MVIVAPLALAIVPSPASAAVCADSIRWMADVEYVPSGENRSHGPLGSLQGRR